MTLKTHYDKVKEFQSFLELGPETMTRDRLIKFRLEFLKEELAEYEKAVLEGDAVGQIDALVDLEYVLLGNAYLSGFDSYDKHFDAVHNANMRKEKGLKPGREASGGFDAIKPEGWIGPEEDHAFLLANSPINPAVFAD